MTDTWKTAASMPTARAFFGAVLGSDGRIYVVGGYNDSGYLSTVEVYDPSTNTWSTTAPLHIARAGLDVASVGNRLLAIGGEQVNGPEGFLSDVTEECRCSLR
jgi:N-acetylneuraminic acid mutarotase